MTKVLTSDLTLVDEAGKTRATTAAAAAAAVVCVALLTLCSNNVIGAN